MKRIAGAQALGPVAAKALAGGAPAQTLRNTKRAPGLADGWKTVAGHEWECKLKREAILKVVTRLAIGEDVAIAPKHVQTNVWAMRQ